MNSINKRYYIYFGAAVLILALVFGAGVSNWFGAGELWAAQDAQDAPTQLVNATPAEMAEIAALAPSQEVLSGLYAETAPSVVNIQVTLSPSAAMIPGMPEGFPFPIRSAVKKASRAYPNARRGRAAASSSTWTATS